MKREEAIEKIKDIKSLVEKYDDVVALRMAIEALKQEPCEDAVSREAVLMEIDKYMCGVPFDEKGIDVVLKELPPVTPKQKWIPTSERLPDGLEFVLCTCHSLIDDREDWVIETVYNPHFANSPYSVWGNFPMLNSGDCEVTAWMHRDIPEPYKAESEDNE